MTPRLTQFPFNAIFSGLKSHRVKRKILYIATAFALRSLRFLRWAEHGARPLFLGLWHLLTPIGRLFLRYAVLPFYSFGVTSRIKLRRLALPARGAIFFLITNRYLLHVTVGVLAMVTIAMNLHGKQVRAQDIGHASILFALASEERGDIVEEHVRSNARATQTSYVSVATIRSIPHVDFDYDDTEDQRLPTTSIPGTIAVQPYSEPSETSRAPRMKTETYVVQDSDTVSSIAQRFSVNVGTILWNNNLTEREYIRPGDTLVIPPVSGLLVKVKSGDTLAKIAKRFDGDEDEIASFNNLSSERALFAGTILIVPGGRPAEIERTFTQIAAHPELPPARLPHRIAQKPPNADVRDVPTKHLFWPTIDHGITQYYGWRHTGVDIDGDYTSPIYASADGVIEKAGWNSGGYGLMILIDHPNGVKTRYGHASKLFVKAGDTVTRGQVIAMVGTTGRSTGTHLHFEVYVNDRRTNPLQYIR